jgi:hypothetical protein
MEEVSIIIFAIIFFLVLYFCGGSNSSASSSQIKIKKSNSLFTLFGGSSYSRFVDRFTSLEDVTMAIRKAGLESCGLIFGE